MNGSVLWGRGRGAASGGGGWLTAMAMVTELNADMISLLMAV